MTVTEIIADFVLRMNSDFFGNDVQEKAKLMLLDSFGCMLGGSNSASVMKAREYSRFISEKKISTIIGSKGFKTSPYNAAMVNAMAIHVQDYDDINMALGGHPSVIALPTALAVGEMQDISGEEFLNAYITGIEAMSVIGRGLRNYNSGWNNTATIGVFGAAATAGKILGLNKMQLMDAFGIAMGESSGMKMNFGTRAKDLNAATATSKGIMAAIFAKLGIDACKDAFENTAGFIATVNPEFCIEDVKAAIKTKKFAILNPGTITKAYASCRGTHNIIEASLKIAQKYKFDINEIEKINCYATEEVINADKYECAQTPAEGKFSGAYCIAIALLNKKVVVADFNAEEYRHKEKILEIMHKVHMIKNNRLYEESGRKFAVKLDVYLKNGKKYSHTAYEAKGDPEMPMSEQDRIEKFKDCTHEICTEEVSDYMIDLLLHIEKQKSIKQVIERIGSMLV